MSTHAPHPPSPSATDSAAAPLVEMRGITKIYPNGVLANHEVTFAVRAGEIHALVGENGAGKSTLMKILYGMERPSAGQIFLRGRPTTIHSPHEAIARGIGMVHQNFMLVPSFTIAENIVLGTEPLRGAFVDRRAAIAITTQLAQQYGLSVDPEARVDVVPVGMRQRVEILKALYRGADVLILDEPTAVLTPQETHELFTAIQRLIQAGKTVIFISHKLREVMEISDRISVMRDARMVGTLDKREANERLLAKMMVGREVFLNIEKPPAQRGPLVLNVRNLEYATETGVEVLKGVSLSVYAGEILGIAGVEGNGQTELVEVIAGLRTPLSGVIELNGKSIAGLTPRQVRQAGVAHIPEDRLTNGVALTASIQENLIVDRYTREPFTRGGLMRPAAVARNSEALIEAYAIRAPDGSLPVGALSGGNMQKVVVARELSSQPKLLIAAQPTRGVDIGATEFMHAQLVGARNAGVAILLVSADLSEVMSLSDRLAVMHAGRIVALFPSTEGLTEEEVGLYMLGTKTMSQSEIESHW
ncbi:MAG: heme ABC transporter ATP-binding protein [Candidatus Roseilinea sp.]|nr:MAG: heme ABC transporter ATP-binding protein [Candidatus Roseilinea sp.]